MYENTRVQDTWWPHDHFISDANFFNCRTRAQNQFRPHIIRIKSVFLPCLMTSLYSLPHLNIILKILFSTLSCAFRSMHNSVQILTWSFVFGYGHKHWRWGNSVSTTHRLTHQSWNQKWLVVLCEVAWVMRNMFSKLIISTAKIIFNCPMKTKVNKTLDKDALTGQLISSFNISTLREDKFWH